MSERTTPTGIPETGIASIGIHFPSLALPVEELARLRGVDPDKYTIGLGCSEMALCPDDAGVVPLATEAARRALTRWGGDRERIGLLAVGTETAVDMSRPLSAWVADELGFAGRVRSYEVKHACYGGTLALRQAAEWRLSGAARGKAALVLAADVALYAPGDPGEPTQGAGAVAFVVDDPRIAALDAASYPYSEPAFDFWRPVGDAFPKVDGQFSLECYKRAAAECYQALVEDTGEPAEEVVDRFVYLCFHVPFPKMVKKAVVAIGERFGWDPERISALYAEKVEPTMVWNRMSGNAYTASLWISVAQVLRGLPEGERIAAFSYGSGFGAELLTLTAGPEAAEGAWAADVETDLAGRERLDGERYQELRGA
jgi:hydroxymethylglutaryl-CoA synthase